MAYIKCIVYYSILKLDCTLNKKWVTRFIFNIYINKKFKISKILLCTDAGLNNWKWWWTSRFDDLELLLPTKKNWLHKTWGGLDLGRLGDCSGKCKEASAADRLF
jgi:hypothetical protein